MSAPQRLSAIAAVLTVLLPLPAPAGQADDPRTSNGPSKSAPLAAELAQLLEASGLTSLAAKASQQAGEYVAALYIPGSQLLVVRGRFPGPERMSYLISQKSYRDAYLDLSGASEATTRVLYSDLGANGLHFGRAKDQPFDMVTAGGKGISFDRIVKKNDDPKEDEYSTTFLKMDQEYAHALQTLIEALKKPS